MKKIALMIIAASFTSSTAFTATTETLNSLASKADIFIKTCDTNILSQIENSGYNIFVNNYLSIKSISDSMTKVNNSKGICAACASMKKVASGYITFEMIKDSSGKILFCRLNNSSNGVGGTGDDGAGSAPGGAGDGF